MTSIPEIVGVAGGIVAMLSVGWTILRAKSGDAKAAAVSAAAVAQRVTVLETKIDLYWQSVAGAAARMLHSPHAENARRDWLLERYNRLSLAERAELAEMLERVVDDHTEPAGDRLAAAQLLGFLAATES